MHSFRAIRICFVYLFWNFYGFNVLAIVQHYSSLFDYIFLKKIIDERISIIRPESDDSFAVLLKFHIQLDLFENSISLAIE